MNTPDATSAPIIYTLANDRVVDQLEALLASIERLYGRDQPVVVIPFDERVERVGAALERHDFASLLADRAVLDKWDRFMARVRPECIDRRRTRLFGGHRKLAAFDGPGARFLFLDADTLLLDRLDSVWAALDRFDLVCCDHQHRHPRHVFDPGSPRTQALFGRDWHRSVFCSGFFAGHSGALDDQLLARCEQLLAEGEREVFRDGGPDQPLVNYLVLRGGLSVGNLALEDSAYSGVGTWAGSSHFEREGNRLLDRGRPVLYLHWVGYPDSAFRALCRGENVDLPYRDLFLDFRFAAEPGARPRLSGPGRRWDRRSWRDRLGALLERG